MFTIAAPFEALLRPENTLVWRANAMVADKFSLALFGLRVTAEPGKRVRQQVSEALSALPTIHEPALFVSRRWLGTTTKATLVVVGCFKGGIAEACQEGGIESRHFRSAKLPKLHWEDTCLYRSGNVIVWTGTHETEGCVYASETVIRSWGLAPKPTTPRTIEAERFNADAEAEILSAVAR